MDSEVKYGIRIGSYGASGYELSFAEACRYACNASYKLENGRTAYVFQWPETDGTLAIYKSGKAFLSVRALMTQRQDIMVNIDDQDKLDVIVAGMMGSIHHISSEWRVVDGETCAVFKWSWLDNAISGEVVVDPKLLNYPDHIRDLVSQDVVRQRRLSKAAPPDSQEAE